MRFFTPELFVLFNSSHPDEANTADEKWEAAIEEYRKHIDSLRDRMPLGVKDLSSLCLHDAELLIDPQSVELPFFLNTFNPAGRSVIAIISVRQDQQIFSLIYALIGRIRQSASQEKWPFSPHYVHWLYDEVDLAQDDSSAWIHRIMFSDGRVFEIPFASAIVNSIPIPSKVNDPGRQIA